MELTVGSGFVGIENTSNNEEMSSTILVKKMPSTGSPPARKSENNMSIQSDQ